LFFSCLVLFMKILFFSNVAFIVFTFGIVRDTIMSLNIAFFTPMLSVAHDAIIAFKTLIL
jgi:hypothetical protein